MNRKEKAKKVYSILNQTYKSTPVPLDHDDPYTLLIAVLLSAQCTDERVNKVTPHLFKKAKTPKRRREGVARRPRTGRIRCSGPTDSPVRRRTLAVTL